MTKALRQTVLIIGAAGFVGRHTLRRLADKGHVVHATHIPTRPPPPVDGVTWIACDLTAPASVERWPAHCDSVIYLAQSQRQRNFPEGASDMLQVNVAAPLRTAEYVRQVGAERLIAASSGSVYTQTERPAQEDEPFALHQVHNFYRASKLAAELLLQPYKGLFTVGVLRLFMPYGAGQDPTMLLPTLVRRVQEGKPISLHGKDGLHANPVAVADVAETLERCLSLNRSVTLNVAGPEVLTLREIGMCIGRVLALEPRFETQAGQTPPVIVGDITALKAALGWAPTTDFEAGLRAWLQGTGGESGIITPRCNKG